jgi:hypothetical protein
MSDAHHSPVDDLSDVACDANSLRPEIDPETGVDLSLIRENLKLTPWERLLANDDTVNFCDAAAASLKAQHATPDRTSRPVD